MKITFHKELASGKWFELSLIEQMANIGSEVSRTRKWQGKDKDTFWGAVARALELFDLTLSDPKLKGRLTEIARTKELFCDAVMGGKEYRSSLEDLDNYFLQYALYLRKNM
ncbi:MAG: hypothetical protein FJZ05_01555 [Candidatus Nealsonbacteria bacterium]|nr:hypothetical protein [Candidatus Nealsonbacteria bacterium]